MNSHQAAVQSPVQAFQIDPQQPAYAGDYLVSFADGITIMQELDGLFIDMSEDGTGGA